MVQDSTTYYVWIGGSCDYGHKERAGGAAVVIEHDGSIISRDVISDLHTTEFRMMLTLMVKVMNELPDGSDILFLTNAAYIQNFDRTPTAKSANPDLISYRYEHQLPTIITSNLTPQQISEVYGKRIGDRLKETTEIVPFLNGSYRG